MRVAKEEMAIMLPSGLSYASPGEAGAQAAAQARRDSGKGLGERIARAVQYVIDLPHRMAVSAELRTLSDRELTDVGLSRADIPYVCNRAFAATRERMPRRYQG